MSSNKTVKYVDFGYSTAKEYWEEIGLAAHKRFKVAQNRQTAIEVSMPAWHVLEWVWHEINPGVDTGNASGNYKAFKDEKIGRCPELAWVRDIAEAGKHRGLGRPTPAVEVQRVSPELQLLTGADGCLLTDHDGVLLAGYGDALELQLTDGTTHRVEDVIATVITFWQRYFHNPA